MEKGGRSPPPRSEFLIERSVVGDRSSQQSQKDQRHEKTASASGSGFFNDDRSFHDRGFHPTGKSGSGGDAGDYGSESKLLHTFLQIRRHMNNAASANKGALWGGYRQLAFSESRKKFVFPVEIGRGVVKLATPALRLAPQTGPKQAPGACR